MNPCIREYLSEEERELHRVAAEAVVERDPVPRPMAEWIELALAEADAIKHRGTLRVVGDE